MSDKMGEFSFSASLTSASSLIVSPEDSLIESNSDYTSVFGNAKLDFSIPIGNIEKKDNESYFSYNRIMGKIFPEEQQMQTDEFEIEDDAEYFNSPGLLTFEC